LFFLSFFARRAVRGAVIRSGKQQKINSLRNALRRNAWNPLEEAQPARIAITLSA